MTVVLLSCVGAGYGFGVVIGKAYSLLFHFEDRALAADVGGVLVGGVGFFAWLGWAITTWAGSGG